MVIADEIRSLTPPADISDVMNAVGDLLDESIIPKKENLGRDVAVFTYAHLIGAMVGMSIAGMLAEIAYLYLFGTKVVLMIATALLVWYGIKLKE